MQEKSSQNHGAFFLQKLSYKIWLKKHVEYLITQKTPHQLECSLPKSFNLGKQIRVLKTKLKQRVNSKAIVGTEKKKNKKQEKEKSTMCCFRHFQHNMGTLCLQMKNN